jgi:hypothetical protein
MNKTRLEDVRDKKTGLPKLVPGTGMLQKREVSNRRSGYDFTFSVPTPEKLPKFAPSSERNGLGSRKFQGTVRERCFEGTLDGLCSDVESATLRDDVLEVLRLLAIGVSIENSLNERVQGVDR